MIYGKVKVNKTDTFQKAYFFALKIDDDDDGKGIINHLVKKGLKKIMMNTDDNNYENIDDILLQWNPPRDYHVTTLYEPNKYNNNKHPAYESFIEGQKETIQVIGMVYIPQKIISFIIKATTPIQNTIPHLTALLNQYSAKHSNTIMESIFLKGKPLHLLYSILHNSSTNNTSNQHIVIKLSNITILHQLNIIYVIFFNHYYSLETTMTSYQKTPLPSSSCYNPLCFILINQCFNYSLQ